MLTAVITVLGWLAIPVAAVCIVDDWFLRPKRQIAAAPQAHRDRPALRAAYYALPVLVAAAVIRLLASPTLDFSLVLFIIAVATGIVWLFDATVLAKHRARTAQAAGKDLSVVTEPGTVDYARSFFPVAVIVLLVRAFLFEPFRIPSDSMMPTLIDGDFILVNKFDYGLRLPVINKKIVSIGEPHLGDVVVFRYPPNPTENYIKRVVGLPGDHVSVHDDLITINGKAVPTTPLGLYSDGCYEGMHLMRETFDDHSHEIMYCPATGDIATAPLASCDRQMSVGYVCPASTPFGDEEHGSWPLHVIPPGKYFMMGDNRDNSSDGRYWGYVPEANLIGKATLIWFNWNWHSSRGPIWSRIGMRIR